MSGPCLDSELPKDILRESGKLNMDWVLDDFKELSSTLLGAIVTR